MISRRVYSSKYESSLDFLSLTSLVPLLDHRSAANITTEFDCTACVCAFTFLGKGLDREKK